MELNQERRLERHGQDPSLHYRRLYVVILDDDVLLEYLDGIDLICPLPLSQHDLSANNIGGSNIAASDQQTNKQSGKLYNEEETFVINRSTLSYFLPLTFPKDPLPSNIRKLKS